MPRLVITFPTLFDVLSAEQLLRNKVACRPTPTPPGLSASICGMSVELLDPQQEEDALEALAKSSLKPSGVFHLP